MNRTAPHLDAAADDARATVDPVCGMTVDPGKAAGRAEHRGRIRWPEFANRWMWLCPALAVVIAAAVLRSFGLSWWSALLAAVLLVCPVLLLWGAVQVALDERRSRRRPMT